MRILSIAVALSVAACSSTTDVNRGAATTCDNTKVKLARYDRRVLPGGGFSFDVTVTASACANTPIVLVARYPVFEDNHAGPPHNHVGEDLTGLWSLPNNYTWTQIAKAGNATTYRVTGAGVPNQPGLFDLDLGIAEASFHDLFVEVTCSDGIYCNGEERWVKNACVTANGSVEVRLPCGQNETDPCLNYTCIEETRSCSQLPVGGGACAVCTAPHCTPHCKNTQECGDNGCGGTCGTCQAPSTCIGGKCLVGPPTPGSCLNPAALFPTAGSVVPVTGTTDPVQFPDGVMVISDNNAIDTLDLVKPECQAGDVVEKVYQFTLTNKQGFEIRMISGDDEPLGLDTLLAVQVSCNERLTFPTGSCSDDATPPGGLASRVFGTLDAGTYVVIATGYAGSQVGDYKLYVHFNGKACTPQCDGKECGDDGCGHPCGPACPTGFVCNVGGKCIDPSCEPDCSARACGPSANACVVEGTPENETCGTCGKGKTCDFESGQCVPQKLCDTFLPDCKSKRPPENGKKVYCGSDCEWHYADEAILDLVPNDANRVKQSMLFQKRDFAVSSCALVEGCVNGSGLRTLLRFDTEVYNVGDAGFNAPSPQSRPDLFEYSACHGHFHFNGFARFDLYTPTGQPAIRGGKLAYCMEDTIAYQSGPSVSCEGASTCDAQGIQKGWTDLYARDLDCQWLDITNLATGWYCYEVCTNYARNFQEYSFDNNCTRFPVYVPSASNIPTGTDLLYSSVSAQGAPPSCNF